MTCKDQLHKRLTGDLRHLTFDLTQRLAMARRYPVRTRPQTLQERLMPCAQFKALEARCQARREQGIDFDKSTINDDDEDDDNNAEDAGDP
jgi:hypothetical protein